MNIRMIEITAALILKETNNDTRNRLILHMKTLLNMKHQEKLIHSLYLNMDSDSRINLKELSPKICGVPFHLLSEIFGMRTAINILCQIIASWIKEDILHTQGEHNGTNQPS